MLKIFLWGTGYIAEKLWNECQTLNQYELLGFIDNNSKKQGNIFKGLKIYSPNILRECEVDYIVILTDFYDEIYQQIIDVYPEKKDIIVNKNFFIREVF